MKSRTTRRFRDQFATLPESVQRRAKEAYRRFQENPWYGGLRFKRIHAAQRIYSVRIGVGYRAIGQRNENDMTWFWIGSHADYDRLVRQL